MGYEMSLHACLLISSAIFAVLGIISIALTVVFREPHISVLQVLFETKTLLNGDNFKPWGKRCRYLLAVFLLAALLCGFWSVFEASKAIEVL